MNKNLIKKINSILLSGTIGCSFLFSMTPTVSAMAATTESKCESSWNSSYEWAEWVNENYTVRNDIWGKGAGPQNVWAYSYNNWGVWSAQPETEGIKSYPHVEKKINKKISEITRLKSKFNVTVPTSNVNMETTYDIWLDNSKYEIMIWENAYGDVSPISYNYNAEGKAIPCYENVKVGKEYWNVYRGNNGGNEVFSFVRTKGNVNKDSVDIAAVIKWIKAVPKWYDDVSVDSVQFGFEITSSCNNWSGYNFKVNDYSVTVE